MVCQKYLWASSPQDRGVKERLVQLQRCMRSVQETGGAWSPEGQESDSLGAILALMAAVLTECDLHCHSQALGLMAKRLGERASHLYYHTHTHKCQHTRSPHTHSKQKLNEAGRVSVIGECIGI